MKFGVYVLPQVILAQPEIRAGPEHEKAPWTRRPHVVRL